MDSYALDDQIQARRGKRRRALLGVLLISSLATLGASAMSLAVFTDSESTQGRWTAGSIDLTVGPQPVAFSAVGVMPGDTGEHTINVGNAGTTDLRYAISSSGGGAFAGEIQVAIYGGACPAAGTALAADDANLVAVGSNAQGAQAGDRVLLAGENEDLCFAWELPLGTAPGFAGASATVTYTFDAEQTDNN